MTSNIKNLQEIIKNCKLNTTNEKHAFAIAYLLVNSAPVYKDEYATKRAGYDIYVTEDSRCSICNLGDRLEVNFENGTSKNIWFN